MTEVSVEMLMREIRSFAPEAVLTQEADGNVAVVLNMKYDMGLLRSFDYTDTDEVE